MGLGGIGPLELIIVLVIALIVLGPKRLPEAGRSIGRGMREFKDSLSGSNHDDDDAVALPARNVETVTPSTPVPTTTTSVPASAPAAVTEPAATSVPASSTN